ncbi:hypothetical protein A3K42_00315 [candidate division WWE3 bacterium RBG_13_37_7]|uniref:RND efflux pump membrane fusion protein barrel-sandwich domain-containing protein n=1 Tax=candidate division WWE3 bacterium RBG_13_37_7 TaxID=1802609 RepID=A0A1F4U255_UNCKA|nr:MAG: hypothetical protein A3K42_00315 [candidate division WWE3 bacterium RBG_13_37_7]
MTKIRSFLAKFKWILLAVIIIAGIILGGQFFLNKSETNGQTQQAATAVVKKGNIISSVSASGNIQTANYLALTTSINGIVKKVFVKEGDRVVKGQKIMELTLDSEGERSQSSSYASYLKAKISVDSAKNSLISLENTMVQKEEAFNSLKKINSYRTHNERVNYTLAENEYTKAKNDYDIQKANIAQAEVSLNNAWLDYQTQSSIITATADGVIANIVSVEGTKVSNSVSERSTQTVASIKMEGTPIASLDVTELDINKVKVGQKVNMTLDSVSKETFTGTVVGIDKIGSVQSGVSNYPVIIKFDSDSEKVLPNMGADADIITEEKADVLYIPTSAIQTSNGKKFAEVVQGDTTNKVEITTGISDSTNIEIISGLNENDEVLINTLPTTGFTSSSSSQNRSGVSVFGAFSGRK